MLLCRMPGLTRSVKCSTEQETFYHHFPWFLKVHRYDNQEQLIADLSNRVILPAETKVQELRHLQRE